MSSHSEKLTSYLCTYIVRFYFYLDAFVRHNTLLAFIRLLYMARLLPELEIVLHRLKWQKGAE